MSLPNNCGTNMGWNYCSWMMGTPEHGLLLVYLRIDPKLLHFSSMRDNRLFQICMKHKAVRHTLFIESVSEDVQVVLYVASTLDEFV